MKFSKYRKKIKKKLTRARVELSGSMLANMPETLCLVLGYTEKMKE